MSKPLTIIERCTRGEITATVALEMYEEENAQLRNLLGATLQDSDRLDWMNLHQAGIEVTEPDPLTCRVAASDDYKLTGASNPYDVRKAIDAARNAES